MKIITILLTVFALKSCGNQKATASMQDEINAKQTEILSGTYNINLVANNKELPEKIYLTFDETKNRVSGFAGCNNFSGAYTVDGNSLKIGEMVSTKMHCKRFMDVEQNVLKALGQVSSFSIKDNVLNLKNESSNLLEAKKQVVNKLVQDSEYIIEYVAATRGVYYSTTIKDNTVSHQNKRGIDPVSRACNKDEIDSISEKINSIELEQLGELKAPSNGRFTDRAAIAKLKITHNGVTYETPEFDHGNPNKYIAELVKTITSMTEKN